MKQQAKEKLHGKHVGTSEFLRARPYKNETATVRPGRDGGALVEVPLNRPRWLVPPISWIVPYSTVRRVQLDGLGMAVLNMCSGSNTVENIIEKLAAANKLSFREAQLSVTQFLQQMTERGLVAIVGSENEAGKK